MLEPSRYLERRYPDTQPAMRQHWSRLAFIHYAVPPESLLEHIPPELQLDTFPDESGVEMGWVGIVAFAMRDIRFVDLPPIPTTTHFLETNVRTYVHNNGLDPGVWFFSLDASSLLACAAARLWYGLPYFHSDMHETVGGDCVEYSLRRFDDPQAEAKLSYRFSADAAPAKPGSLDYFLIERYRLYSIHRGRLMTGMVRHAPYPISDLHNLELETNLPESLELPRLPIRHVCFSAGVKVDVWSIEPCGT